MRRQALAEREAEHVELEASLTWQSAGDKAQRRRFQPPS